MQAPKRIELPSFFGMGTVNAWLFTSPEIVLIDCGENSDASWKALNTQLNAYGIQVEEIQKIYVTHAHVDHVGMTARIAAASNAEVFIPEYAYDACVHTEISNKRRFKIISDILMEMEPDPTAPMNANFNRIFGSFDDFWLPVPEEVAQKLPMQNHQVQLGGSLWEILYAPGHCNNQICFYQKEEAYLIAADMILKILPTPVIEPKLVAPYDRNISMMQLIESLERFRDMPIKTVFPGHYEIIYNKNEVLQKQLNRIQERKEECYQFTSEAPRSFLEIIESLYGKHYAFPCIPATLGYLDLLLIEKRIQKQMTPSGVVYSG